ncbi:response regulator [Streptomyces sp. Y2F8-2]|uniref:response regulator n=1 Tax=Streptomyces sp. Y2F8-2 TaxID=2759675 RepID=UPI001F291B51|nr:response regulator [Streptomyces sp. Y2F8-2]
MRHVFPCGTIALDFVGTCRRVEDRLETSGPAPRTARPLVGPGFRRIATTLLTARGLRVVAESGDGASALAAVRAHRPDGLLLDLHLPDLDGLTVARQLTREDDPPRIVLTSTDKSFWSQEELRRAGIESFVAKDKLFDADLRGLFAPSVSRRQPRAGAPSPPAAPRYCPR